MPRARVTRRVHFSAAHRLHREDWSAERNRRVYGDCAHPNWHGHNYEMDVTVEGEVDPETGYVIDLAELRDLLMVRVVEDLDHRNLNLDVGWLDGRVPTTENLAVAVWERLEPSMPVGVELESVVIRETSRNRVEYRGE